MWGNWFCYVSNVCLLIQLAYPISNDRSIKTSNWHVNCKYIGFYYNRQQQQQNLCCGCACGGVFLRMHNWNIERESIESQYTNFIHPEIYQKFNFNQHKEFTFNVHFHRHRMWAKRQFQFLIFLFCFCNHKAVQCELLLFSAATAAIATNGHNNKIIKDFIFKLYFSCLCHASQPFLLLLPNLRINCLL